jgi:hypothetical protein
MTLDYKFRTNCKQYPHRVGFDDHKTSMAAFVWCHKTFAEGTWYTSFAAFFFKNKEDAELFIMRWS